MGEESPNRSDVDRIDDLRERWQAFDNTGDESLVVEFLADDVVLLPPGDPPIRGNATIERSLREFPSNAYDVEHTSEELLLSGDLAVDYVSIEGTKLDDAGDVAEAVSLKAVDVYRKGTEGRWQLAISIWNDHA